MTPEPDPRPYPADPRPVVDPAPSDSADPPTYSGRLDPPGVARRRRALPGVDGGWGPFDESRRMPPTEFGGDQ